MISSFGVEYNRNDDSYDWTKFRSFGKLERKLDETLTEYFKAFYAMCKRVNGRRLTDEEENLPISVDPISEERASRCLARIDLLSKIREEILNHPELDERLQLCQNSMDLPDWWVCGKHDKDLMIGAAKYGLNRLDFNLANDTELSFYEVFKQLEEANEEKKAETDEQKLEDKPKDSENLENLNENQTEIKTEEETKDQIEKTEPNDVEEKIEIKDQINEESEVRAEESEVTNDTKVEDIDENKAHNENEVKDEPIVENGDKITENPEEVSEKIIDEKVEIKSPKIETETEPKVEKDLGLRQLLDKKIEYEDKKTDFEVDLSKTENFDKNEKPVLSPKEVKEEIKEELVEENKTETDIKEEQQKELIEENPKESENNEKDSEEKMEIDEQNENNTESN